MKSLLLHLILLISSTLAFAGAGKLEGKVVDESNMPLIGAIVKLEGTAIGASTDIDGKFLIKNIPFGTYTLIASYTSYDKKSIAEIKVTDATVQFLTIALNKSNKGLGEVVIKGTVKKENINALLIQQKNMATISDGISAESIKRSPDKNTGDVLKRVTGVSISERKFVVIRGLSDRYNLALLNGSILPSTEADRKAFSFDMFPASMLDNITIIKAATPDMPGEFAGGIIDLVTKDIPTENFVNLQIGTGANSQGTFRSYHDTKNGKLDWLGIDDGMRALPNAFPQTDSFQSSTFTRAQKYEASKTLTSNWGVINHHAMLPNRVIQTTAGYSHTFKNKSSFGAIGAVSYNRSQRFNYITRKEFEQDNSLVYDYTDTVAKDEVLAGVLLNMGYKLNGRNKFAFRNGYNINSEDQTINRIGVMNKTQLVQANSSQFTSNTLVTSQLSGEHVVSKRNIKVQWSGAYNHVNRNTPDLKKMIYERYSDNPDDSVYTAIVPINRGSAIYAGKFYSTLKEKIYNGKVDVSVPFTIKNVNQMVKVGAYLQSKNRTFNSRVLGYAISNPVKFNNALGDLPQDKIFNDENIGEEGFRIDDVTEPTGSYTANSGLHAAYLMMDNKFLEKFRIVYGIRLEDFTQELHSASDKNTLSALKKSNTDLLPSANITYSLNMKTNIRFCASKTLSRPEFRELASFAFYDFNTSSVLAGYDKLEECKIQNYDLRYELFPGRGQLFSFSLFYKHFNHPIEFHTLAYRFKSYINADMANNYGAEMEFRKSLAFMSDNKSSAWNKISLFGNMAYIKSVVKIVAEGSGVNEQRPMQGQSPYLINLGTSYTDSKSGFGATLLYNRIGERLVEVGYGTDYTNMYEYSRNVIDFQLSKKFKAFEFRLSFSDLLHQPYIFYQNDDNSRAYSKSKSKVETKTDLGSSLGLSCSYKF